MEQVDKYKEIDGRFDKEFDSYDELGNVELKRHFLTFLHITLEEQEKKIIEKIEKLRPESCDCNGEKFECEHWGRHKVIDQIIELLRNK